MFHRLRFTDRGTGENRVPNRRRAYALAAGAVIVAVVLLSGIWSCKNPVGAPHPNTYPETRLANVPANDTIAIYIRLGAVPQQTLYWVGDDPDGYIIAYRYRWTDYYSGQVSATAYTTILNFTTLAGVSLDTLMLIRGNPQSVFRIYNFFATLNATDADLREAIRDSLVTGRAFAVPYKTGVVSGDSVVGGNPINIEAPTKATFIFYSPSVSNMHRFEVASIDNNDAIDPTPAVVNFWTLESPGPRVYFSQFQPDGRLILRYPTEINPGITFTFGALDPSTDQRDFSWVVDDTLDASRWSPWNPTPAAVVNAINFRFINPGILDTHTIYVKARNKWGVVSPIASRAFTAIVPYIDDPAWPKRTLIINNDRIDGAGAIDTTVVNSFYGEVMDSLGKNFDIWTTSSHAAGGRPVGAYQFPTRDIISKYSTVIVLTEQRLLPPTLGIRNLINTAKQGVLKEYLNAGGKLIYSGTPDIRNAFFLSSSYDSWASDVFHVVPQLSTQNTQLDFAGARGMLGYPNVRLDTTKVPADSGYALGRIAVNYPRGFGQTFLLFDSKTDRVGFENAPLGVLYLAPDAIPPARQTYSVAFFGFPLYYARKSDVIQLLRKTYQDLRE